MAQDSTPSNLKTRPEDTSSASYKDTPGKEVIFAFSDCRLKVHFKVGRSTKYMTSGTVCSGAIRVML